MTGEDSPRVFVPPPLMYAAFIGLGLLIEREPLASGLRLVAAIIAAMFGGALIISALGLFFRRRTRPEPWRPASSLVIAGPYRRTRNPMYLGLTLVGFAVALAFGSLAVGLLMVLAATIVDRFVIRREETYLTRRFGETYRTYCRSVRRWL